MNFTEGKVIENMGAIYTVKKGRDQVTLSNKESAIDLMYALNVLDCYEPISRQEIKGNKEDMRLYEVDFLGKTIQVVSQADAEKVVHWMLSYGCNKTAIERLIKEGD